MAADALADADDVTLWSAPLRVGPKGTYTISEVNGLVTVTQYQYDKQSGELKLSESLSRSSSAAAAAPTTAIERSMEY